MEQWREDVLIHYGVKGMKWGKTHPARQKNITGVAKNYRVLNPRQKTSGSESSGSSRPSYDDIRNKAKFSKHLAARVYGLQKAKDNYAKTKGLGLEERNNVKQKEQALRKAVVGTRLKNESSREKEDNSYTTTNKQRFQYKKNQAKYKVSKAVKKVKDASEKKKRANQYKRKSAAYKAKKTVSSVLGKFGIN